MNHVVMNIIKILIKNGLIYEEEINDKNYLDVLFGVALNIDSFMYISLLTELEDIYNIEIPDDALVENILVNVVEFAERMLSLIKESKKND